MSAFPARIGRVAAGEPGAHVRIIEDAGRHERLADRGLAAPSRGRAPFVQPGAGTPPLTDAMDERGAGAWPHRGFRGIHRPGRRVGFSGGSVMRTSRRTVHRRAQPQAWANRQYRVTASRNATSMRAAMRHGPTRAGMHPPDRVCVGYASGDAYLSGFAFPLGSAGFGGRLAPVCVVCVPYKGKPHKKE